MSRPKPQTDYELKREWARDIAALKRVGRARLAPYGARSGDAAARDDWYGVPSSTEERAILAGSEWFDTTYGLTFVYYATAADSVAPGLRAAAAGWYPTGPRMPSVLVEKSIAQTIATTTATAVTWSAADGAYDPFDMYSSAQNTRVTVPFTGVWRANVKFRTTGVQGATVVLRVNGVEYPRTRASGSGVSGAATNIPIYAPMSLTAGQYVELFISMAASASQSVTNSGGETFIELTYEGPVPA